MFAHVLEHGEIVVPIVPGIIVPARLSYAVPGCWCFVGRSEHTCGMRAQQEDSVGPNQLATGKH